MPLHRLAFILILVGEVFLFVLDQWMKRSAATVLWNPGFIAQWMPSWLLVMIAVVIVAVCITAMIHSLIQKEQAAFLALGAVLLGVMSGILDLWRVHAFVDWISIRGFAFNGGDILIIGGISGLILEKFKILNPKSEINPKSKIQNV